MRWFVLLGIFILCQLTKAKPVKPRLKTQPTELIREKRNELEEDDGTNEMQKFILDLSAKEDMRRLKERFKKVETRDVESDDEYRKLKRFSIHDTDDREEESPSGKVAMEMRSSRTSREDEDVTSTEPSSSSKAVKNPSLGSKISSSHLASTARDKRSNSKLVEALSNWKPNVRDDVPPDGEDSDSGSDESDNAQNKDGSDESDNVQNKDGSDESDNVQDKDGSDESDNVQDKDGSHESDNVQDKDGSHESDNVQDKDGSHESDNVQDKDGSHELDNVQDKDGSDESDNVQDKDGSDESDNVQDKNNEDDFGTDDSKVHFPNESDDSNDNKSRTLIERNVEEQEFESEPDGIEESGDGTPGEDTSLTSPPGSHVNYHLVGSTWELIHHDPSSPTGSLPSLISTNPTMQSNGNTTMHSEYIQDDVVDDEQLYKRVEKSRRKPRLSKVRVVRSIEPEYEIQEISAVYNEKKDSPDEGSAHIIALDEKPIRSDGYIGCFVDRHPNRDLIKAFTVNELTPDSCRSVCKDKGHTYAGVQYGYLCHCGDDYGKYGHAAEEECNSVCQGDDSKKCGGFWRNSIFATEIFGQNEDEEQEDERESRSHIDKIIPLPESEENEEIPVRQEITAYLRAVIPKYPTKTKPVQTARPQHQNDSSAVAEMPSKRTEMPSERTKMPSPTSQTSRPANIQKIAYLHPQNVARSFIPSKIVLKRLKPAPGKRTYKGTVKLKQNWNDNLKNNKSPKTLILAGNIESALAEMFATDKAFKKAEVLAFSEASIRNDPSTVHKVLVEFVLTFKKSATGKDKKLREMVENSGRLDEMPVFGDTIEIKEYKDDKEQDFSGRSVGKSDDEVPKDTREAPVENQLEDKQDEIDPFLEKVFKQI